MAVKQDLLNLDVYWSNCTGPKIIVNDLSMHNIDDIEAINKELMTVYNSDVIETVPSCDCGATKGAYLLGKICPVCSGTVTDPMDKREPLLWLVPLHPDAKFVNPHFWLMFKKLLHKDFDCLRWLSDTSYNPPIKHPPYLAGMLDVLGGIRSYVNTINNFDKLFVYLLNHSKFKEYDRRETLTMLYDLYKEKKNDILVSHIPIINKKLFVMEVTTKGKFTNLTVAGTIDLIMSWIKASNDKTKTDRKIWNATATAMSKLADIYYSHYGSYLVDKSGNFRKHVFGARSHFTFRTVIVSIPGRHEYDEIHVPWAIGVTAFRPHLLNKLVTKRGYTYKLANSLLYRSVKKYEPIIDELLNELIKESPYNGIPVIEQRNPSLLQGSGQTKRITKFKTDPMDNTTGTSTLCIKAPNGDYDGDELNYTLLLDDVMVQEAKTLEPHYNIPDMSKPFSVSGNLTLLSPSISILANYIHKDIPENGTNGLIFNTVNVQI